MAATVTNPLIRSRRRDPDSRLSVGLRVSHLLNTIDFAPSGFSPSATLIVRRLRDPMPRQLQPDAWAVHSTLPWERAAQSTLSELSRRAARPASGVVPLNANSVLFADHGELLACLAIDLLRGAASSLWWWRAILRSLPSTALDALFTAWCRDAQYVPAALTHLASKSQAAAIVNAFSPAQAWAIFQQLADSFELTRLCSIFQQPFEIIFPPQLSAAPITQAPHPAAANASSAHDANAPAAPPWRQFLSESEVPASLGPEKSALLGVGLAIQQSPRIVRSREFAESFAKWRQSTHLESSTFRKSQPALAAETHSRPAKAPAPSQSPASTQAATSPEQPQQTIQSATAQQTEKPIPPRQTSLPQTPSHSDPVLAPPTPTNFSQHNAEQTTPSPNNNPAIVFTKPSPTPNLAQNAPLETLQPPRPSLAPASEQTVLQPPATPPESLAPPENKLLLGDSFQTELGGILFLINALKNLNLPDSLEQESRHDLGLSSWELLDLLARCLLSSSEPRLLSDPLWTALALLDNRTPSTPPGANFSPSPYYRLPKSWLAQISEPVSRQGLHIRLRHHNLQLWHADGFPISNCQLATQNPRDELQKEIQHFSSDPVAFTKLRKAAMSLTNCQPVGIRLQKPLRRFLAFLLPYLRLRLARSLGISTRINSTLAKTLLLQPAKIYITRSHIDLLMDLHRASGRIRLSGLDANPGWVPTLARVITFHFGNGVPR